MSRLVNNIRIILSKSRLLLMICLFVTSISIYSQSSDIEYKRIPIGDAKHIVSGLALSPDNSTLAISGIQSFPFYIYDWKNHEVLNSFDVGNWYAGSAIEYSAQGKYIVLGKLKYADWAPNKDRELDFEIIDAKSGKYVKRFDAYHSVKLAPDDKYALALTSDEVGFWNLESGKKEKTFQVAEASNSVAISPDGKLIAVSHHLYEKDAKEIPQLQRDKKSLKNALKYKQQITVFDASTFKELYTVNELYDIVYKLKFSQDGKNLFCLNIPHMKIQNTNSSRQMYIQVIDVETTLPKRRGFTSVASYEPDFKLSHDGKLFGVVSRGNNFLEVHVYDFESGKMVHRFQQSYRLFEKNEGGMLAVDSRTSFVFLPDNSGIIMTMGNHLIRWDFKQKDN